jgi:hypothetical protein
MMKCASCGGTTEVALPMEGSEAEKAAFARTWIVAGHPDKPQVERSSGSVRCEVCGSPLDLAQTMSGSGSVDGEPLGIHTCQGCRHTIHVIG